jgi:hypothetical protein
MDDVSVVPATVRLRVCVFCGVRGGHDPRHVATARALGGALALRGMGLVYGGGGVGMMGAVADGALDAGGDVIGVMPEVLTRKEFAHPRVADMRIVDSMHTRKRTMVELADAFVLLPGGFGSLEEYCEVVTWAQIGLHAKPCLVLDLDGYYAPLIAQFDRCVDEGFMLPPVRALARTVPTLEALLASLEATSPATRDAAGFTRLPEIT